MSTDDEAYFPDLCKQHYPGRYKVATLAMWSLFIGFVSFSVFNIFKNAAHAKSVLADHTEVDATVVDVIQILEDGEYTDYSVDLELTVSGESRELTLDIAEDEYVGNYEDATVIPLIYSNADPDEIQLKSYYERRADRSSNWLGILVGYGIVLILLYIARHGVLKVLCPLRPER